MKGPDESSWRFRNAAAEGNQEEVERMLANGLLPSRGSLSAASGEGHLSVVKILLRTNYADARELGKSLWAAVSRKRSRVALCLLDAGAPLTETADLLRTPVLVLAAQNGMDEVACRLLATGADANAHSTSFSAVLTGKSVEITALMAAALKGRENIVRMLLSAGADPTTQDTKGRTAYDLVASRNDRSAIALLLANALKRKGSSSSSRSAPSATIPRKAKKERAVSSFHEAVDWLSERTGHRVEPLDSLIGAFSFGITLDEAVYLLRNRSKKPSRNITALLALVREFAPLFGKVGGSLFLLSDRNRGFLICAVPWADKFKIIRALKTASANYGISNTRLVSFLRELDQRHPFTLERCDRQSIGGRFTGKISNSKALAVELVDFCPFTSEDFHGEVNLFAKALQKEGAFTLHWD